MKDTSRRFAFRRDCRVEGELSLSNGPTFVTFDDAVAIGQKRDALRTRDRQLGRTMASELSSDDATGTLVESDGKVSGARR